MLVFVLLSCKAEKDYLSVAVSSELPTLDLQVNTSLSGRVIMVGNVYEKLFVLDAEGNVREELAESYELSKDGHRLTISIRDGVLFHNGDVLDAEDAAVSMNRYLDYYGTSSLYVGDNRFYVLDPRTIEIESDNSLVLFPYLIAASPQCAVVVPKESLADGILDECIGTGPYKLSKLQSGEYIELVKFDEYCEYSSLESGVWGKKSANIPIIRYYFVSDAVTRRIGLESGLYDFINDVMSQDYEAFEKNKDIDLLSSGETGMIALVFNKEEGPCTSVDFRKALSYLFDSENIMRACYGTRGYSTHPDYMEIEQEGWISGSENPFFKVDRDKAKELLSATYSGETIRILTSNVSNMDKLALACASDLEKAGIKTEVIAVDWATMLEMRKDSSLWDIFISAFSQVPIPSLKSFLNPTFPGWISKEDIALLAPFNNSESLEDAMAVWREVEPLLWEKAPVYVPGHYLTEYAYSSRLEGIIAENGFYFWNAKFK